MYVHLIADTATKLSSLRGLLEGRHAVTSELLSGAGNGCSESEAVVVTADLRVVENITVLREAFGKLGHIRKRIFLIDQKARLLFLPAYALGATHCLDNPRCQANVLAQPA